jgi:hypothetical protein
VAALAEGGAAFLRCCADLRGLKSKAKSATGFDGLSVQAIGKASRKPSSAEALATLTYQGSMRSFERSNALVVGPAASRINGKFCEVACPRSFSASARLEVGLVLVVFPPRAVKHIALAVRGLIVAADRAPEWRNSVAASQNTLDSLLATARSPSRRWFRAFLGMAATTPPPLTSSDQMLRSRWRQRKLLDKCAGAFQTSAEAVQFRTS